MRTVKDAIGQIHEMGLDQYGEIILKQWAEEILSEAFDAAALVVLRKGQPEIKEKYTNADIDIEVYPYRLRISALKEKL